MNVEKAFSILGLSTDAEIAEIKSRYKALAKRAHPDVTHVETDAIRAINVAYSVAMEEAEKRILESVKISYNLEEILKGLRLAMKKYVNGLAISKREDIIRAQKLKEFMFLLEYLKELGKTDTSHTYFATVGFIKGVMRFELLPIEVKIEDVKDRKSYLVYNTIVKQLVRIFEEVFIRLDGIKKRTGLWRYYVIKSLEDYEKIKSIGAEKFVKLLEFVPELFENLSHLVGIFRTHTSLLSYKDFYDIFAKEKMLERLRKQGYLI